MDLHKTLKPSHSVELAVRIKNAHNEITYLKSMLESGYEQGFVKIIIPIYDGRSYNFHVGEKFELIFKSGTDKTSNVYKMPCEVVNRMIENNMPIVLVKQIGDYEKIQRRQSFRLNIYQTYTFHFNENEYELETKDLSSTGMLALTTFKLHPNDYFDFTIDTNIHTQTHSQYDINKRFKLICRVIDCTFDEEVRKYYVRIQFMDVSNTQSQFLLQYLYHKQTEIYSIQHGFTTNDEALSKEEIVLLLAEEQKANQGRLLHVVDTFMLALSAIFYILARPADAYSMEVYYRVFIPFNWNRNYLISAAFTSLLVMAISVYAMTLGRKKSALKRYGLFTFVLASIVLILTVVSTILNWDVIY